jgi:hypothetical protein
VVNLNRKQTLPTTEVVSTVRTAEPQEYTNRKRIDGKSGQGLRTVPPVMMKMDGQT